MEVPKMAAQKIIGQKDKICLTKSLDFWKWHQLDILESIEIGSETFKYFSVAEPFFSNFSQFGSNSLLDSKMNWIWMIDLALKN